MLKNFLLGLAAALVAYHLYTLAWPMVDPQGEVTQGSYRGIKIGDTKAEVVGKLYSFYNSVRLDGYEIGGQPYTIPYLENHPYPLVAADKWLLVYPGFHKETIILKFSNGRVNYIKYQRNALAP